MRIWKKICISLTICTAITTQVFAQDSNEYKFVDQIANFISNMYIGDEYSKDDIIKNALGDYLTKNPEQMIPLLKSACQTLDPYSEFFTAEEYAEYVNQLNQAFYGVGVVINSRDGYVVVTSCIDGGNAQKAGMMDGDKIIRVDGEDVVGLSTDKVKNKIVGENGTSVNIVVLRGGQEISFDVVRAEVRQDTVGYTILEDNVAYIQITTFANTTDAEFEKALAAIDEKGVTNVILDLRDNPGGYLVAAVNIAGMLVPEGVIISTEFRQSESNQVHKSTLKNPKYKLKVLINENTASSSEILTSAIQDSGVGTVYGVDSYGKGVIQDMFQLGGGMAIKLTVGEYKTRNGDTIQGSGIEPDEFIVNKRQPMDMTKFTPFDYKDAWSVGMENNNIKAAEERLAVLGFYPGDIDGKFTGETELAIKLFQTKTELYAYGVLDKTTQVRLENETYATEEILDTQLETAYIDFGGKAENLYK